MDVVFQSFNRYLGVAVGEHLGYALTGAWSLLAGVALTESTAAPSWLGILGIIVGPILMLCSLEFVGVFERTGWRLAPNADADHLHRMVALADHDRGGPARMRNVH